MAQLSAEWAGLEGELLRLLMASTGPAGDPTAALLPPHGSPVAPTAAVRAPPTPPAAARAAAPSPPPLVVPPHGSFVGGGWLDAAAPPLPCGDHGSSEPEAAVRCGGAGWSNRRSTRSFSAGFSPLAESF